jgi:hypothetical protein
MIFVNVLLRLKASQDDGNFLPSHEFLTKKQAIHRERIVRSHHTKRMPGTINDRNMSKATFKHKMKCMTERLFWRDGAHLARHYCVQPSLLRIKSFGDNAACKIAFGEYPAQDSFVHNQYG